ncbi:MAG TPA: hypothetical protein VI259_07000 [Gemmatimonadaceae bacterium]
MSRVFLLSPARCDGRRAQMLLNPDASFDLARRVREPRGAPIGEVFSFLSGLYFRGKLAYATAFGEPIGGFVITTDRGLVTPDTLVTRADLLAFSKVDLATAGDRYVAPLRRHAEQLADDLPAESLIVLLGSIATGKYCDTLTAVFERRLVFPSTFVGRGDMSRGGLLLRHAREGRELAYEPVLGAVRRGKRPPKLERIKR